MTPRTLGVVGAGTMGAGIAQLGCAAGMRTRLHDPLPGGTEMGLGARARRPGEVGWQKGAGEPDAAGSLAPAASLNDLAGCELVIEAAPERLELKRELFAALARRVGRRPCWPRTPRRSP